MVGAAVVGACVVGAAVVGACVVGAAVVGAVVKTSIKFKVTEEQCFTFQSFLISLTISTLLECS